MMHGVSDLMTEPHLFSKPYKDICEFKKYIYFSVCVGDANMGKLLRVSYPFQ